MTLILLLRKLPVLIGVGCTMFTIMAICFFGALTGTAYQQQGMNDPFITDPVGDIPPAYVALYRRAGYDTGIRWAVLAAIGKIESDHGRSNSPGVKSGVNFLGCCAGPMQFNIANGPPSTWDTYGHGGNVYDPADAIPAAARMLKADGAPHDYERAIRAYNNSAAYVAQVLAKADEYEMAGAPLGGNSLVDEANRMSALDMPYLWGGGHLNFDPNGPWDCSGAVSWLLHYLGLLEGGPLTSTGLMSWGKPGRGEKFTVWAKPAHTFIDIESGPHAGQSWGTANHDIDGSLTKGGPIWHHHPTGGFTPRHVEGW
jgi:hypothetical protein